MKSKTKSLAKRWPAFLLCVCMVFPIAGNPVLAAEENGLCEHHPVHTEACGYQEAQPEQPCAYTLSGCSECLIDVSLHASTLAENVTIDGIKYTLSEAPLTEATVIGGTTGKTLTIPATIEVNGTIYQVTTIGERAFYNVSDFCTLTLPNGLVTIEKDAFNGFSGTGLLKIPETVTTIGERAFKNGYYDEIVIGNGVKTLSADVFANVMSLYEAYTNVTLGSGIETIDPSAFSNVAVGTLTIGCSEAKITGVYELENAEEIISIDPNEKDAAWLQEQINNAPDGKRTAIEIADSVKIDKTITVPESKNILLLDKSQTCILSSYTNSIFEIAGKLEINAKNLTFKGTKTKNDSSGSIATINPGGELTLKNGVFCDGTIENMNSGAVYVGKNAVFEMTGGVIENFNTGKSASVLTGTVCVSSGGTFNMSGGTIQNNENATQSYSSAGVLIYTWNKDAKPAVMTMSGSAVIQNNTSLGNNSGGGVYMIGNAKFIMESGTIRDNYSLYGGGVCVAGTGASASASPGVGALEANCEFFMKGGAISGNYASNSGGGIYINSDGVKLTGGTISNNEAGSHGGGVYVSEPPHLLNIYNVIVTKNEASVMGGGLWFCPTGDATMAVTNGVALYENSAAEAGDDFVSLSGSNGVVTLADRLLGGGAIKWYQDGGVIGGTGGTTTPPQNVTGSVDTSIPRFDPDNPGERIMGVNQSNANYALKTIVSPESKELAESQAKLLITGNKANRGGGIGSNGAVDLGETDKEDYTLKVIKEWENTPQEAKEEIVIALKIGDYVMDTVTLNQENEWCAEFTQLPDPASLIGNLEYAVVETPVLESFTPIYKNAEVKGNTITIHVTNVYAKTINIPVTKKWSDDNNRKDIRPKSVTVNLLANGEKTDKKLVLNEDNSWTSSFNNLDECKNGQKIKYTIAEVAVEGYETAITGNTEKGFLVTNSYVPDKPSNPDEPNNPSEPNKPGNPENSSKSDELKDGTPKTNDNSNIALWMGLLGFSCLCIIGSLLFTKKKNHN